MADPEPRVAALEQIARNTEAALSRIEARIDRMDARFDRLDTRLDRMDGRQADDFRFLIRLHFAQLAALASAFLILLGVMAHGFKWL